MLRRTGQVRFRVVHGAEREGARAELFAAVKRIAERDYEILGELGRSERGANAFLARERYGSQLVALKIRQEGREPDGGYRYLLTVDAKLGASIPMAGAACRACANALMGWARFCDRCGADVTGVAAGRTPGTLPEDLLAAVRKAARGAFDILGTMDRAQGGGSVYFAREVATADILALRLRADHEDPELDDGYALETIQIVPPMPDPSPVPSPPSRSLLAPVVRPRMSAAREASVTLATTHALPRLAIRLAAAPAPARRRTALIVALAVAGLVASRALLGTAESGIARQVSYGELGATAGAQTASPRIATVGRSSPPSASSAPAVTAAATAPRATASTSAKMAALPLTPTVKQAPPAATPSVRTSAAVAKRARADSVKARAAFAKARAARVVDSAATLARVRAAATCATSYGAGDWTTALVACGREGEAGRASAQLALATMYESGRGVSRDSKLAISWLRRAAASGDRAARVKLGMAYERGLHVERNVGEALALYRRAAEQGDVWAQNHIGFLHGNGKNVAKNDGEATKWFRMAAERGDASAQYNLGFMYLHGRGVPRSDATAVTWLLKAAAQGHPLARTELARRGAKP